MKNQTKLSLALAVCLFSGSASVFAADDIPSRPEQLKFPAMKYEVPNQADYRVSLKAGPVAYVVPDKERPLINISILVRTGDYLVPLGKEGLAQVTGYLMARGGTKSKTAEQMEERLAFLAAHLNSGVGENQGSVNLELLSKDIDEGMSILRDVLTAPRFQDDKLALYKDQSLQAMKQRNDDSSDIESREREYLAYGENFWANRQTTAASLDSIKREDIEGFHKKWFHPANFIVAANGDFDREAMVQKLEKLFSDWPFQGEKPGPVPTDTQFARPGVYVVDKDVNQGRVSILLPGIKRDNPDLFPIVIMNDVLGGGGFTSHIMNRVRSDEGLAYSAGSSFPGGIYYPLTFTAGFQSKSRTVAYAVSIVLDEMKKMGSTTPDDEELKTSKNGIIDRFPKTFSTKGQIATTFAQDEYTGRYEKNPDFWKNYRKNVEAVSAVDVQRVAKNYLTEDKLAILIVGDKKEIMQGHPNYKASLEEIAKGKIVDVPLRDPLTMQPMTK